jgi:hypothetical protein
MNDFRINAPAERTPSAGLTEIILQLGLDPPWCLTGEVT